MRRAAVIAISIATTVLVPACGNSDSVGTLPGDQGAATGLTRGVACTRFERIVRAASSDSDGTAEELEALADETADDALADQIRRAAGEVGDGNDRDPAPPARCDNA